MLHDVKHGIFCHLTKTLQQENSFAANLNFKVIGQKQEEDCYMLSWQLFRSHDDGVICTNLSTCQQDISEVNYII